MCLVHPKTKEKKEFTELICSHNYLQYVYVLCTKTVLATEKVKKTRRLLEQPKVVLLLSVTAYLECTFASLSMKHSYNTVSLG